MFLYFSPFILQIVGTNGVLNIDSKLRLQLYWPPPRSKRQPKRIEVFDWWRMYPRNKYPSTLFVTVKGITLPEHVSKPPVLFFNCSTLRFSNMVILTRQVDPSIRSMMALQEERGSASYHDLQKEITKRSLTQLVDSSPPALKWSRLPGQARGIWSASFDFTDRRLLTPPHNHWL